MGIELDELLIKRRALVASDFVKGSFPKVTIAPEGMAHDAVVQVVTTALIVREGLITDTEDDFHEHQRRLKVSTVESFCETLEEKSTKNIDGLIGDQTFFTNRRQFDATALSIFNKPDKGFSKLLSSFVELKQFVEDGLVVAVDGVVGVHDLHQLL